MPRAPAVDSPAGWRAYYRWTAKRPPRELLRQLLTHLEWEGGTRRRRRAVDLGFGAGTDTLELLRHGWQVLAVDGQEGAGRFLEQRVPPRLRRNPTIVIAPMEEVELPSVDLVYASFSLPFCPPDRFPRLWSGVRQALRPGGHFAGQLFGDRDAWAGQSRFTFCRREEVLRLARGLRVELLRETDERGRSFRGPKRWHFFDLILEKPRRPA